VCFNGRVFRIVSLGNFLLFFIVKEGYFHIIIIRVYCLIFNCSSYDMNTQSKLVTQARQSYMKNNQSGCHSTDMLHTCLRYCHIVTTASPLWLISWATETVVNNWWVMAAWKYDVSPLLCTCCTMSPSWSSTVIRTFHSSTCSHPPTSCMVALHTCLKHLLIVSSCAKWQSFPRCHENPVSH